jgi:xanthine dehydrogenase accessory factor
LRRDDAAYVGLIGSKSKRGRFVHQFRRNGGTEKQVARLVSPIAGGRSGDKRPAVIAAFAAAEIADALLSTHAKSNGKSKRGRAA